MLVGRSMMAGFGAAHPGDGLHRCLFDLLTFNEATCSKKKSSFQDMRRMPDAPYKREYQFVPCFFWGSGCSPSASCSPVSPGEPGHWWPMLVAPWGPPSWPIGPGVITADILWAYCPALAANGARPWPVHRDRLLIVTAALLLGFCQLLCTSNRSRCQKILHCTHTHSSVHMPAGRAVLVQSHLGMVLRRPVESHKFRL